MFPTHPFSGVTVPVSGFLIVTRRLRDCVKSRNGEGKGERHIRSAFGASATSRQPLSGGYATLLLFARQSVAYPYAPAFQGCRQVVGYFATRLAVRFNRLLFSEWMPFCFSGSIIFFFRKQLQWLYACMVMFSPQNPQVCSSVAAFHFIVQSLFSIRGILYASFFGFIFLKGIAEVSSGVSIGG